MEIRIRETGDVLTEVQFSDLHNTTFAALDEATLDAFGADLVHPGTPPEGAFWQHPVRDGVEQSNGKWYTRYTLGPVFDTDAQREAYIAQKTTERAQAIQTAIIDATQRRLTDFAATRNYGSLEAISKYKDITDAEIASLPAADRPLVSKFRAECRYLALVTAQTWAVLYRGLAEVEAGTRPMPTGYADIEGELPVLQWPIGTSTGV